MCTRMARASGRVRHALLWLKANNPFYKDIEIDEEGLEALPVDGIPSGLNAVGTFAAG